MSSQQEEAHFSDLDDEIIADDWVVPRQEISRRRLLKRTPRYNVYKADWFGDVLVYEPLSPRTRSTTISSTGRPTTESDDMAAAEMSRAEELRLRLANLNLDIGGRQPSAIPIKRPQGSIADSDQADSAYSSISSTPHYHSKNLKSEFEFPQLQLTSSPSMSCQTAAVAVAAAVSQQQDKSSSKISSPRRTPVILNKDSYVFNFEFATSRQQDEREQRDGHQGTSTWQELNELRLIAHEGFMLFMGASVDDSYSQSLGVATGQSSTSLVMQMNHPKAVSLHNLLHRHKHQQHLNSPSDRFFSARQYQGVVAKLNICQQIRDAMTYLHGKDIVHGKLTSVNIYIEPNQTVKISLIDNDERPIASINSDDNNSIEFNNPALVYLSPELTRTIKIGAAAAAAAGGHRSNEDDGEDDYDETLVQIDTRQLTKKSDLFSFGTILYELFHERLPFERLPATEVIYRIGSGQMEDTCSSLLAASECPAHVQDTISACWSTNPQDRPEFKHLYFDTN